MQKNNQKIRVRIAPSPTGLWHIGNLRTALFNYLFARQNGGDFVLRVEDTDQARLVPGSVENILGILNTAGIVIDEGPYLKDGQILEKGDFGPYTQSKRLDLYKKHALELADKKAAYYCFCTAQRLTELRDSQQAQKLAPRYDKHCLNLSEDEISKRLQNNEPHVIRLNVQPGEDIEFDDLVYGHVKISSRDVDDQVLLKSDGFPTYHLAVVIDDNLMDITHIIRGEEWISSTPKHILLYRALGWEIPAYAHLPLLLGKSGKKLSKRENDVAVSDFFAKGYLPEALINFIALLGWNPKTEQEIFNLDELIKEFSFAKVNKAGAVFDMDRLDWINGLYIRQLQLPDLQKRIKPFLTQANISYEDYSDEFVQAILGLERERLKKLSEIGDRIRYFFEEPEYNSEILIWKKSNREATKQNLEVLHEYVKNIPADKFQKDFLETEIKKFLTEQNIPTGDALWPLRVALSGLEASPSPFEIMGAFGVLPNGKDIVLDRISKAAAKLS
jgi:glutamyl-tRNA synthetase